MYVPEKGEIRFYLWDHNAIDIFSRLYHGIKDKIIFRRLYLPEKGERRLHRWDNNVINIFSELYLPEIFRALFLPDTKKSSFNDQIDYPKESKIAIKSSKDGIKDHIEDPSERKIVSEIEDQIEDDPRKIVFN